MRIYSYIACFAATMIVAPHAAASDRAYSTAHEYFSSHIAGPGGMDDRYTMQNCEPSPAPIPGYAGYPVKRCKYFYKSGGLNRWAIIWVLNPSPKQLARWVSGACDAAGMKGDTHCARVVSARIWCSNNAQFPVTGLLLESAKAAGYTSITKLKANPPVFLEFRDGVTVRTTLKIGNGRPRKWRNWPYNGTVHGATNQLTVEIMERSSTAKVARAFEWARIAAANRQQYRAAGGARNVGVSETGDTDSLRWLDVSRKSYLNAWGGDSYSLLNAWAIDAKTRSHFGKFRKNFIGCPKAIFD